MEKIKSDEEQKTTIRTALGDIAHDMRTPLAVLKAYVEKDMSSTDEDSIEYKEAARRSIDKLLRLAEELADYSKATEHR